MADAATGVPDALSGVGSGVADAADGVPDALSGVGSGVADAADGFTGGSFADSLRNSVGDAIPGSVGDVVPDAVSDAVPGSIGDTLPDSVGDAVPDSVGDVVPDGVSDAVSGTIGDAIPDALSGAAPDALSGAVPDALSGAVPDAFSGTVPDGIADAVPGFGAAGSPGESNPGSLLGDVADHLGGAIPGSGGDQPSADSPLGDLPASDLPGGDDVGAALAETMSARSDELSDPASSGIPGLGALAGDQAGEVADDVSTTAADAAAGASEFFTADIPASDLGSLEERPPTDLDALPPPSFDPPGGVSVPPALDGLGDLADPVTGFSAPEADVDPLAPGVEPLFDSPGDAPTADASSMPAPSGFDSPGADPSIGGFNLPPDETLAPPVSNPGAMPGGGEVGGAAAAALGLPMAGEPAPSIGIPDETIVAPLSQPGGPGPNPAETGQFQPVPDAQAWDAPAGGQFGAPPSQADGPGSMPWGQAGTPGGPPVAGGLDQAVLQDTRSGSSKTLLFVGLGVAALVLLGLLAFTLLGGSDDDGGGDASGPGSLAEPHARTTPVEIFYPTADAEQRFVVEVLEPVRDASALADGTPPADGQRFAVTSVRVANQSAADASVSDLRFNAVTASGQVLEQDANGCAITQPALDTTAVLGQAGVAEGVVCWVVPADDYDGLLLGIESTQVSGRIHISLQ